MPKGRNLGESFVVGDQDCSQQDGLDGDLHVERAECFCLWLAVLLEGHRTLSFFPHPGLDRNELDKPVQKAHSLLPYPGFCNPYNSSALATEEIHAIHQIAMTTSGHALPATFL